jgi:glutathione S-transferase
MMRLYSAPASPFGRKVKMTVIIKGLGDRIESVHADTRGAQNAELAAANPLQKIPALVLEDGTQVYDSKVICECLDGMALEPVLLPPPGMARIRCLTRGALADGIAEAALLMVYEERYRPADKRVPDWLARQQLKVAGGLDAAEAGVQPFSGAPDYGDVALAAALGYLDLRLGLGWRATRPKLVAWLDAFAKAVPAYDMTQPVG